MGENSAIEWTDHTFNPWSGCTKVSPGCANCYAERLSARGMRTTKGERTLGQWGPGAPRKRTSAANWRKPLAWNRRARGELKAWRGRACSWAEDECPSAERVGQRHVIDDEARCVRCELQFSRHPARPRVFCASLADWLDPEVPAEWLADLLALIAATPELDWLLLTKRPELWLERMVVADESGSDWAGVWVGGLVPPNVWVGTSVEDQQRADERIPHLMQIPARVRFLSCEPLLGPVDLGEWIGDEDCHACGARFWGDSVRAPWLRSVEFEGAEGETKVCPRCEFQSGPDDATIGDVYDPDGFGPGIHWVIAAGESGPKARPMHPAWVRSLRDQCVAAGVPFHFKQHGAWVPLSYEQARAEREWGVRKDLRVIWPNGTEGSAVMGDPATAWERGMRAVKRVGKKKAGRELDGRTWDEVPS